MLALYRKQYKICQLVMGYFDREWGYFDRAIKVTPFDGVTLIGLWTTFSRDRYEEIQQRKLGEAMKFYVNVLHSRHQKQ